MRKLKAIPILKGFFTGDAPDILPQMKMLDKTRNKTDKIKSHKSLGPAGVSKELNDETVMRNCLHETVSVSQNCREASETSCKREL